LWVDEVENERVGFVAADALPPGWLTIAAAQDDDGEAYLLAHADDVALQRMALFDVVINNADRKGGHVLNLADGSLRGVDHGVCFHVDNKLRTVLWGWVGPTGAAGRTRGPAGPARRPRRRAGRPAPRAPGG
jgi:uncharacterized repeat protein (TIGR03843 family)